LKQIVYTGKAYYYWPFQLFYYGNFKQLRKQNYFIQLKFEKRNLEQDHSNKYIPFCYENLFAQLTLSKKFLFSGKTLVLKIIPEWQKRYGTEIIFERVKVRTKPVAYDWKILSKFNRYSSEKIGFNFHALFSLPSGINKSNDFSFAIGFMKKNEKFHSPDLYYKYSALNAALSHNYKILKQFYIFSLQYGISYSGIFNKASKVLSNTVTEKAFVYDINNEMKNALAVNLALRIDYTIDKSKVLYFMPKIVFTSINDIKIWNVVLTTGILL
jgi:hypothetical protein